MSKTRFYLLRFSFWTKRNFLIIGQTFEQNEKELPRSHTAGNVHGKFPLKENLKNVSAPNEKICPKRF